MSSKRLGKGINAIINPKPKKKASTSSRSGVNNIKINLSAVERRTATLTKRRTVKKEFQVAWLLKAITLIDLTTL